MHLVMHINSILVYFFYLCVIHTYYNLLSIHLSMNIYIIVRFFSDFKLHGARGRVTE